MAVTEMERSEPRKADAVLGDEPWLRLRLKARPEAAGRARHALDDLRGRIDAAALEALQLLVSEVVTNSIRHAGISSRSVIDLTVKPAGRAVRVEVCDRGRGFDAGHVPVDARDVGGWGLYLVQQLAERWGVDQDRVTRVWFEIENPAD